MPVITTAFTMATTITITITLVLVFCYISTGTTSEELFREKKSLVDFISRSSLFGKSQSFIVSLVESNKEIQVQPGLISSECWQSSLQYLNWIREMLNPNHTTDIPNWAYEMVDSTAKIPSSIRDGNLMWLGSFSECLRIRNVNNDGDGETEEFRGKYCLGGFTNKDFVQDNITITQMYEFVIHPHESVPLVQLMDHSLILFGLCWPSSCNGTEISELTLKLGSLTNFEAEMIIMPTTCQVDEPKDYDASTIAAITVLCFFLAIVIISTVAEIVLIYTNKDSAASSNGRRMTFAIITSFSLYKNGKKLLQTQKSNEETLRCIQGMRLFSMLWVVLGHTFLLIGGATPWTNYFDLAYLIRDPLFEVILNGTFSVDTFFVLSGFLVVYMLMRELKKTGGRFNIFVFYFHRYWRMTPLLAMVMAFISGPLILMGNGPLWPKIASAWQEGCRDNWWISLLYLTSYFDNRMMCNGVTWYLSTDMTFYIISPLIIYPLYKKPILGYIMFGICFLITTITPGLYIYLNNIPGFPNFQAFTGTPKGKQYIDKVYYKPWCRMGPYLVGMILAYYLNEKNMKVKLNKMALLIGWLLATALGLTLIFGTYHYFTGDSQMSDAMNAIYGAFSRTAWGLVVAWVIFVCVTGQGGPVNKFLSWRAFAPLSRLTYGTYLIHFSILMLYFYTQQQPMYFDYYLVAILYMGLVMLSMGVAFSMSLAFETPLINLERLLLPMLLERRLKATKTTPSTTATDECGEVSTEEKQHDP